eukprot:CAMPEP_0116102420 /NCGR_PEP_ID=MMETSP0327-20121206/13339_1 /TAXON_ID=44447 /ORGANISM="Pseudo-nitzschia delicatissima, Strain B596" /LENGTH=300 /DNA_ID=CAMNT_0003594457 /DNA_START=95 /DNA_END=997 /DNA_ORIENTATION=+
MSTVSNLRLLHTLNVLCICMCVCVCVGIVAIGKIDAFQPANTRRAMRSSLLSSSVSKDTESMVSPVRVVNAALINGPAHAAALEQMATNDRPDPTHTTSESTQPSSPIYNNTEKPSEQLVSPPASSKAPPKTSQTQRTKRQTPKSPVTTVESIEELLAVMDCHQDTITTQEDCEMTLILFHAHYCKICQRATMQLTKAAREYPMVNFAKVESKVIPEPSSDNLRTLGISKFPFVQIYRNGDCVASFSTGPTHMFMRKVRGTLDLCLERDEDCWEGFSTEFASEIQGNRDARNQLRPGLLP